MLPHPVKAETSNINTKIIANVFFIVMHKAYREGNLNKFLIQSIMSEEKANQKEMFKVPMERIKQYAPKATPQQLEEFVLKACEHYRKYLIRQRDRDTR